MPRVPTVLGRVSTKKRGDRTRAVYHHVMGLFRSRARKNRETTTVELPAEPTATVTAPAEVTRREVTAETRPNPDRPGWGRSIGQEIGKARGAALATNKDE